MQASSDRASERFITGLLGKGWSITPVALGLALALPALACRTAQVYLDPRQPVYTGSFAGDSVPTRGPEAGPEAGLRIVTFNVEYALRIDRALAALRDHPQLREADLVALQEMDAPGTEAIARGLGLYYVYYPASVHPKHNRDVGNAILSRWPIESTFKLPLPHRSRLLGQARLAAGAVVRVRGQRVRVYSLHLGAPLGNSPGHRRDQLQVILCDAQESGSDAVVVAGDLNSGSLGERMVTAGYRWLTRGIGHTTRRFSFDHVFVRGLPMGDSRAGVARDVKDASDHRPVWVDLLPAAAKDGPAARAEAPR